MNMSMIRNKYFRKNELPDENKDHQKDTHRLTVEQNRTENKFIATISFAVYNTNAI